MQENGREQNLTGAEIFDTVWWQHVIVYRPKCMHADTSGLSH